MEKTINPIKITPKMQKFYSSNKATSIKNLWPYEATKETKELIIIACKYHNITHEELESFYRDRVISLSHIDDYLFLPLVLAITFDTILTVRTFTMYDEIIDILSQDLTYYYAETKCYNIVKVSRDIIRVIRAVYAYIDRKSISIKEKSIIHKSWLKTWNINNLVLLLMREYGIGSPNLNINNIHMFVNIGMVSSDKNTTLTLRPWDLHFTIWAGETIKDNELQCEWNIEREVILYVGKPNILTESNDTITFINIERSPLIFGTITDYIMRVCRAEHKQKLQEELASMSTVDSYSILKRSSDSLNLNSLPSNKKICHKMHDSN